MYQKEYRQMNEKVLPRKGLSDSVRERAGCRRKKGFRSMAAVAAVLALILASAPVMAENLPWILERIAPELTQTLEPVQRSDTNNGITMEVVAASVKRHQIELVVRVEGDALKKPQGITPELCTSRDGLKDGSIRSITDYEGAETDKANGIYYYQAVMNYRKRLPSEKPLNSEITVSLGEIITSTFAVEETEIPLILTDAAEIERCTLTELEKRGYNIGWGGSTDDPQGRSVMRINGSVSCDVTDDLSLVAASYIDGKLHVQLRARNTQDDHQNLVWDYLGPWLTDEQGNRVKPEYCNFFSTAPGGMRVGYAEYIFDIPQEKLENYKLSVTLEEIDTIHADCEVIFRLTEDEIATE